MISLILTTIVAGAMPAIALLVKYVMDKVFIAKDQFWLILMAMAVIIIYLIKSICDYFSYYNMNDVGQSVIRDIRDRLYNHIQTLSMPYFIRTTHRHPYQQDHQ